MTKRPYIAGLIAADTLLALFVILVTSISGWATTKSQFGQYWFFLVPLAVGFGIQVGLYVYLREVVKRMMPKKVITITGTTSTAAMISCCAHYLVNILPIISAAGVASFIGQYQVELFWIGIAFNVLGIAYIVRQAARARRNADGMQTMTEPSPPSTKPLLNNAVVVGSFVLVVAAVSIFSGQTGQTSVPAAAAESAAAIENSGLTKTNTENGLTVAVTPQRNADGSWDFSVVIDNHAVNVTQDMVSASSLVDANGQAVQPKVWTGDPPGGHHRQGVLKFGAFPAGRATLTIRDLGNIPVRTFTWDNLSS